VNRAARLCTLSECEGASSKSAGEDREGEMPVTGLLEPQGRSAGSRGSNGWSSGFLVIAYLVAIVAANLLAAAFGPKVAIGNAFLFIGLDLTVRDRLHERWRGHALATKMGTLIAAGSVVSWVLSPAAGRVAGASLIAFALASTVDSLSYHLLHERAYLVKVNGSNVVSALVDSFVFPSLAFGALMPGVVAGQFLAKVGGGFVWSLLLGRPRGHDVGLGGRGRQGAARP